MLGQTGRALLKSSTVSTVAQRAYSQFLVSGHPRTRVPFGEKVVHGLIIGAGMLSIPAFVLTDLKNLRPPQPEA